MLQFADGSQALPYYLALTFYIWVSWREKPVFAFVFRKEVQAMATLPQGQEPSPFMQPQAHPLSLLSQAIFGTALGIHPSP